MIYEDKIHKVETIKKMKRILVWLSRHINSIGFDTYIERKYGTSTSINDEDGIMNYINYTRSIVHIRNDDVSHNYQTRLIEAITSKDDKERQDHKLVMEWMMYNITQLDRKRGNYIIDKYIHHMKNKQIITKYGIAESTLTRNLNKAYIELAILLEIEIFES